MKTATYLGVELSYLAAIQKAEQQLAKYHDYQTEGNFRFHSFCITSTFELEVYSVYLTAVYLK